MLCSELVIRDHANWSTTYNNVWMRFLTLFLLSLPSIFSAWTCQATPVAAQGPSVEQDASGEPSPAVKAELSGDTQPSELAFHKTEFPVAREGFVFLSWDKVANAVQYEVIDSEQRNQYRGVFPQAFISGLSNGNHRFEVIAYDPSNQVIARSGQPAELVVEHWSLRRAFILFFIGLAVFMAIIAVILIGSWTSPSSHTSIPSQAAETT